MAARNPNGIHPIGCACSACGPLSERKRYAGIALKGVTRVLFLIAALVVIPFIIVHALSSAKGDRR